MAVKKGSALNRTWDLEHWPGLGLASRHPSTRGQCQAPHGARAGSRVISGEGCVCIALRRQAQSSIEESGCFSPSRVREEQSWGRRRWHDEQIQAPPPRREDESDSRCKPPGDMWQYVAHSKDWTSPSLYVDLAPALHRACFDFMIIQDGSLIPDAYHRRI